MHFRSDLHHVYPSDGSANISKSNNVIGIVTETPGFDNGVIKTGQSTIGGGDATFKVWEPSDDTKGDFARTYMYMVTCYQDYCDLWTGQGMNMLEKNTYPTLQKWAVDLLLSWNEIDPVDQIEMDRNENVYQIQGNRNPFIDYPQLAQYIWGAKTANKFYTTSVSDPKIFMPTDKQVFDFGLQSLLVGLNESIVIRGRNLAENLVVTSSNPDYILNKAYFTPSEIEEGATLNITSNPTTESSSQTIITLTSGSLSSSFTVKSNYIAGIPAYDATDIVCTQNTKKFTANWKSISGINTYKLSIYTKNEDGQKVYNIENEEVASNSYTLSSGVKASTTYYYSLTGDYSNGEVTKTLTSNEIVVEMPAAKPVFSASKYD